MFLRLRPDWDSSLRVPSIAASRLQKKCTARPATGNLTRPESWATGRTLLGTAEIVSVMSNTAASSSIRVGSVA